jgi:6-phosphogluconolactonase
VAGSGSVATGPNCVVIEPALGIYLYTSNNTDNSVSAQQLDPHTGSLKPVQGTQFSAQPLPTCAVAIANGAHATQLVN